MRMVKVPMAVDAKVTIPVGPVNLPIRSVLLLVLVAPLAYICMTSIDGTAKFVAPICLFAVAGMIGLPEREGVWIGSFVFFNLINPLLPRIVRGGRSGRGRVRRVGQGISVGKLRKPLLVPPPVNRWTKLSRARSYESGLIERTPGGWCAVVTLKGPDSAPHTDAYADWCKQVMEWLLAVESPAQVVARTVHYDRADIEATYEAHCAVLHTKLGQFERQLSGDVADRTMVMEHHVVFMPGMAGKDGVPMATDLFRLSQATDTPRAEAERVLQSALRLASTFDVEVSLPGADEVAALSESTVLGAREATTSHGMTFMGGRYHGYLAVNALPPKLTTGGIVAALMRARGQGIMSMHVMPVDVSTARSQLTKVRAAYRYASKHSSDVDTQMMAADTEALIAALAGRQVLAVRAGLLMSVSGQSPDECNESISRLHAALAGEGIRSEQVTTPGFVAASAASPGGVPLRRTLLMTTDLVATCLLPAMGTPFGDPAQPLLGINASTGAPIYLDVFRRANHNAVIVGTSGAGKSVSCKTMLVRHVAQGAKTIVIDPDSEYGLVTRALNGRYVELGEASINVLAMDPETAPDEAAGLIIPVLSVMGGEEVGYKDGRPIRRLNDADKAWLHEEMVHFLSTWQRYRPMEEPVLTNLIEHLMTDASARCTSDAQRERCREIGFRLRGFTQGPRARIFDRPSSFSLDHPVMGIGLRELALQFRADITPAMAIVLTRILQQLARRDGKLVVLVDEAHRVTSDPDASQVLDQLVRQARKYGAGVWMASQAVDDFVRTDLGRILAATAATKLILGIEQTVAEEARSAFGIATHEMGALTPRFTPGRGVLISGPERAIVQVLPGDHLMPLVNTSFAAVAS
jgi:Helicase HerA, central domain